VAGGEDYTFVDAHESSLRYDFGGRRGIAYSTLTGKRSASEFEGKALERDLLSRRLSCKGRSHNNEKGEDFGFGEPLSALNNRRKVVFSSFGEGAVRG
jgi:hypothetical protein